VPDVAAAAPLAPTPAWAPLDGGVLVRVPLDEEGAAAAAAAASTLACAFGASFAPAALEEGTRAVLCVVPPAASGAPGAVPLFLSLHGGIDLISAGSFLYTAPPRLEAVEPPLLALPAAAISAGAASDAHPLRLVGRIVPPALAVRIRAAASAGDVLLVRCVWERTSVASAGVRASGALESPARVAADGSAIECGALPHLALADVERAGGALTFALSARLAFAADAADAAVSGDAWAREDVRALRFGAEAGSAERALVSVFAPPAPVSLSPP
jgi:hypothetical protein